MYFLENDSVDQENALFIERANGDKKIFLEKTPREQSKRIKLPTSFGPLIDLNAWESRSPVDPFILIQVLNVCRVQVPGEKDDFFNLDVVSLTPEPLEKVFGNNIIVNPDPIPEIRKKTHTFLKGGLYYGIGIVRLRMIGICSGTASGFRRRIFGEDKYR
ncbi:MAG: hypothetical protein Q8O95_05060 [bacterium]|nr:hypothetical protein [bacterium]